MQEDYYILLLSKQFSGEISPPEAALLEEWRRQSPENAELAAQYKLIWEKSASTPAVFALDLDAEFNRFQSRLAAPKPAARVIPLGYRLIRAAAVLVLLVAAVWGYRQYTAPAAVALETTNGLEKRLVELPDGSRVWLRNHSTLEHPVAFNGRARRVKLNGEAYFEVAHNAKQPFYVETPDGGTVEVLGTHFQVRADGSNPESQVLVREGKVRFSPQGAATQVILRANDKAVYNRQTAQLRTAHVSSLNELAWQTGGLEFVRTPLEDVVADLEKYYHVKIELRNPALAHCLHTAPLTSQPLEKVLESLKLIYRINVTNPAPGQYILTEGSCQ